MQQSGRLMAPISKEDLLNLKKLALKEHEAFFIRNPHLKSSYYNSLIGIFLCQGAACHYVDRITGVKDWDIWFFYVKKVTVYFPYRKHKRIEHGYKDKPMDFLRRAIPKELFDYFENHPALTVMKYLLERNTKTKRQLLKKAIIGLYPEIVFAKVLWKGA